MAGVNRTLGVVELTERYRSVPQGVRDILVTVLVAWPTLMDAWWNETGTRQADVWTYVLAIAMVLPLLVRRRWPVPVALVSAAAFTGLSLLGHHGELLNLPVMVALYTVADLGTRRRTIAAGVVAALWSGALGFTSDDPIGARGGSPVLEVLWPLVALAFGEIARTRRELVALAAQERELEAQQRVAAERTRVAREVHDVVAHTMAAVNVQMTAALAAFDSRPDVARTSVERARDASRDAMTELRSTVALLRDHGTDDDPSAPLPRLDQLDEIASTARAAGIEVTLVDERSGARLPTTVELAGFRIAQEAVTNVIRHSGARHAEITVADHDGTLRVRVDDDGVGPNGRGPGDRGADSHGYGLTGMVERARAVGGRVDVGRAESGGFRVVAELPTGPSMTTGLR